MKRTIEIVASFTGTISTGSYENEKPFFSAKEIIEPYDESDPCNVMTDEQISLRQAELHDICYKAFQKQAELSYQDKIAKTYQNIRFYDGPDGLRFPSVTSIIGWDSDFHCSPDELAQYAARGTIIHKLVELYLTDGNVRLPKEVPEIYPELVILQQGSLGLQIDDVDFPAYFTAYPIKVLSLEKTVLNEELRYGGRADIIAVIESSNKGKWDKVEGILFDVPTVLDVKTGTLDKTQGFKQQTAYAKCLPDVQQLGLIHLNKEVKQGYSKPTVIQDLDKYWTLFKRDRDNFRKRYKV
jgi:hypothetical protein